MTDHNLTTLADVDAAEQAIRDRAEHEAAELRATRERLTVEAEQARHEAALARLEVLDGDLIPAAIARGEQARAALSEMVRDGSNPLLDALLTIAESHLSTHALRTEATAMAATAGVARPDIFHAGAAPNLLELLLEELRIAAEERRPDPVPLPASPVVLSHEEQLDRERAKRHTDVLIMQMLELSPAQVAAIPPAEYAARVTEAEAERDRRQAEADRHEPPSEVEPGFRSMQAKVGP